MGGINDWFYGPPHETKKARKTLAQVADASRKNIDDRIGIGEFAAGISRDQRNWSDLKIRPIERALSTVIRNRLSGDQSALVADAQNNTLDAFDKAGEEAVRGAARRGVVLDPSEDRGFGLDKTKSAVQVGNIAAREDRDSALSDARRFYQGGAGLPGMASQQYIAGAGSLVDQQDYSTGRKVGDAMSQIETQESVGMQFADGGEVGGVGVRGGRVLEGESTRVELNSGDFIIPKHSIDFYGEEFWDKLVAENGGDVEGSGYAHGGDIHYADGGSVFNTVHLKNKHTEELSQGNTDKQFGEWLEENGYHLAGDGQVAPAGDMMARAPTRKPDTRPRTPGFLFEPRNKTDKPPGYAEGGGVGFGLGEGIRRGIGEGVGATIGAVKKGLTYGLLDARATENHESLMADRDAARGYLKEDRAYQDEQRKASKTKLEYDRDIDAATAMFVKSDGTDLSPIFGVQKKYTGAGGNVATTRNPDGTFNLAEIGNDGKPMSEPKQFSQDEIRNIGMNMIESMRDPKALIKSWNDKPTTVSTADGATSSAWNQRTRKWEQIASNPKDPKANTDKYSPQRAYDQISRLIGERMGGKYDDITGKMIKPPDDPEYATQLTAAGHQFERQNPGSLAPGEVVNNLFNKAAGAVREDDAKKAVRKEIGEKTGYFSTDETDLGMPRKDYEAKRVKELTGGGFGLGVGAPQTPAATPTTPAKPAAAPVKAPPGFKPTMLQAVNAMGRGKDPQAVAARLKQMGHSDAEVKATLDFYQQNARR